MKIQFKSVSDLQRENAICAKQILIQIWTKMKSNVIKSNVPKQTKDFWILCQKWLEFCAKLATRATLCYGLSQSHLNFSPAPVDLLVPSKQLRMKNLQRKEKSQTMAATVIYASCAMFICVPCVWLSRGKPFMEQHQLSRLLCYQTQDPIFAQLQLRMTLWIVIWPLVFPQRIKAMQKNLHQAMIKSWPCVR